MAKIKEEEYIKLVNTLGTELENAYAGMKGLHDAYEALLKGDNDGPYWNGSSAKSFYKTARNNLNNSIEAYKEAAQNWETLYNKYQKLKSKGYFTD